MATLTWEIDITADDVAAISEALATLGDAVTSSDINVDAKTVTVTTSLSAGEVEAALGALGKELKLNA
jgi:hypothetical protein